MPDALRSKWILRFANFTVQRLFMIRVSWLSNSRAYGRSLYTLLALQCHLVKAMSLPLPRQLLDQTLVRECDSSDLFQFGGLQ